MSRSPWRRAPAPALAILILSAACAPKHGSPGPSQDAVQDPCNPYTIGATCPVALEPNGVTDVVFAAPGLEEVDVNVTGSTSHVNVVFGERYGDRISPTGTCGDVTFGKDRSCVTGSGGGSIRRLFIFETDGFAGTTYVTIGRAQDLGSQGRPVPISTDGLVNASVAADGESHFSFEAASSATHTVALTGLFSQLEWALYADPDLAVTVQVCSFASHQPDLACEASLSRGTRYHLRVRERSGAPQEFQLTIGSGAGNEGSPAAPVALGAPGRVSTVDVFGHSHYTFTPDASGPHAIMVMGHSAAIHGETYSYPSDLAWTVFEDPGFTTSVVRKCPDYRELRSGMEGCLAELRAGVPYHLRVDERAGYPNRVFELAIAAWPGPGSTGGHQEGAVGAPVPASWGSGWGSVPAHGSSYYSFDTAADATGEAFRIIAVSHWDGSNVAWVLFDDAGFTHEVMRCERARGVAAQSCLTPALEPGTTYYLRVDERDGVAQLVGIDLVPRRKPPTSPSAGAAATIPVGASGIHVVQDNTLSTGFYTFTAAAPGTYRVDAKLSTGDGFALTGWTLYDDAAYSSEVAHCFKTGGIRTAGSSCTVGLRAGTFFLKVQALGPQSGTPSSIITADDDLLLAVERVR